MKMSEYKEAVRVLELIVDSGEWYSSALEIDTYEKGFICGEELENMAREAIRNVKERSKQWNDNMDEAPRGATIENPCKEHWILGIDDTGEQRVIRWCMEYPCAEGVWMYAYSPTEYIDDIQEFYPVAWMPLPEPPNKGYSK